MKWIFLERSITIKRVLYLTDSSILSGIFPYNIPLCLLIPSCLRRCICWISSSSSSSYSTFLRIWIGASNFQYTRYPVLCFFYRLKNIISFSGCSKRVDKFESVLVCFFAALVPERASSPQQLKPTRVSR